MGKEEGCGSAGWVQGQLEVRQPEGIVQVLVVFGGWLFQGIVQALTDLDWAGKTGPFGQGSNVQPGLMQGGMGGRGQVEWQLH